MAAVHDLSMRYGGVSHSTSFIIMPAPSQPSYTSRLCSACTHAARRQAALVATKKLAQIHDQPNQPPAGNEWLYSLEQSSKQSSHVRQTL